jgi:DNA ligase 1
MTCFPFELTTIDDGFEFGVESILNVANLKSAVKNDFMAGCFEDELDFDHFTGADVIVMKIDNYYSKNPGFFSQAKDWKTIDAFKQDFKEYPFIIVTTEEHQIDIDILDETGQQVVEVLPARDMFYVLFPLKTLLGANDLIENSKDLQKAYLVSGVSYFSFFEDIVFPNKSTSNIDYPYESTSNIDYPYESTSNPIVEVNDGPGDLLNDLHSGKLKKVLPLIQYFNESVFPVLDFDKVYHPLDIVNEDSKQFFCNCPFHDDEKVSFAVNKADLNWECKYGCGQGSPLYFTQRRHLLIYNDALELLSKQAAVKKNMPKTSLTPQETFDQLSELDPNLNIYPINGELFHASGSKFKRVANFTIQLLYRMKSSINPFDDGMDYMVKVTPVKKKETTFFLRGKEFGTNPAFKTKLMNSAGLSWSGTPKAFDSLREYLMESQPPEIRMVDKIGYDEKSDCYLLGDILFDPEGNLVKADKNGLFFNQKICLDKQVIHTTSPINEFDDISMVKFLDELFGAFGGKGILVFSFFVSSLFGRQIINGKKFFPFLSLYGDPHTGKTSLTDILLKCFFLNWSGKNIGKLNTSKGLIRSICIRKNFVTPLTEGQDTGPKIFDTSTFLDMYEWKDIAVSAQLGSPNKTRSLKYEGSLLFVQNNEWFEGIPLIERIISLPFSSTDNTEETLKILKKLQSYSDKQLASIGKQILERRNEIESELLEGIELVEEFLKKDGCAEPRFIDNSAILLSGFKAIYKAFDLGKKSKIDFKPVFELLSELTKGKEAKPMGTLYGLVSLFFESCYELLDMKIPGTDQPDPKLIKGEHYIIENGLLYLRISATMDVFRVNKKRYWTPTKLLKELENHQAIEKRIYEKRSSLWTSKKPKADGRNPKASCMVLRLDELDDLGEKFENPNYPDFPMVIASKKSKATTPATTKNKHSHGETSTPNFQPAKSSNNINYTGAPSAIAEMLAREADIQPQAAVTTSQQTGIKTFGLLYKRTNVGKVQQWTIQVQGNKFRTISGQKDGAQTASNWTECKGKNVGKSNATTGEEQALKEAEAKFKKQLDKGYDQDIANIDEKKFVKPMLARKYEDFFENDFTNVYSQPKLDGMRCLVTKDGMFSRAGKPILAVPHVISALHHLFDMYPEIVFDGELYTDKLKDDFNKIISLAKKTKPTPADIAESANNLEYWVYDIVTDDIFTTRFNRLSQMLQGIPGIVIVPTQPATNQTELDELYQGYRDERMEGQMVRDGNSLYKHKRTKNLLKRKDFQDDEFTIVSLNEGKGNAAGMMKSATLATADGIHFKAGINGDDDYLKSLMVNPAQYVGSEAKVKFQELTPDGKPRFGKVISIYNGKRDV